MTRIEFNRTSNIFINSGIVALTWYLENRRDELGLEYSYELSPNKLVIESAQLFTLLEEVYYHMGKEVYDTSGKKAREKIEKFYFKKEEEPTPFYKMKTYGLGELITNDPTPTAGKNGKLLKFNKLLKEDPEFAAEIAEFYEANGFKIKGYRWYQGEIVSDPGQKGDSNIFIDDKYTKTTKLVVDKAFFEPGDQACYLSGEKYKKLVDIQNTSPFFSGLLNFTSYQSSQSHKISWKAMYLSRFSPKLCLYSYVSGLDSLICYFFNSDDLTNLYRLFRNNRAFYRDEMQLIEHNYLSNIQLIGFNPNVDEERHKSAISDFTNQSEILFMLIYQFYKQFLSNNTHVEDKENFMSYFGEEIQRTPVSLVSFRADKFTSRLRPNAYEEFNNFKFTVSLIHYLEHKGIDFQELLRSLKFIKPREKGGQNSYQLERRVRGEVLDLILHQKSIAPVLSKLFYECFMLKMANEYVGYKRYSQLKNLVELYEPIIHFGGNTTMNKDIQEKAINLGTSIGQGILRFADDGKVDQTKNAKNGRRYIIGLYKSRNLAQFNDAIIRIMNKYKIVMSKELMLNLEQSNFEAVKQFTIIGALNQINSAINQAKA